MNDFASLPWYVRHGAVALFFGIYALAYRGWWGLIAIPICLAVTVGMQAALDGKNPKNW